MSVRTAPGGALSERWPNAAGSAVRRVHAARAATHPATDDLFERTAWLYAFLREHVFRDDTLRIETALWPSGGPANGSLLLEIGCGPGVYTRQLAARHAGLRAIGIDRSPGLLQRAEDRAVQDGIPNCWFEEGNALALDWPDASADAVVASRLLTVVDGPAALAEIYRVLRPGGRCFIAEPATLVDTLAPMAALRAAGWLTASAQNRTPASTPPWPRNLTSDQFGALVSTQPWATRMVYQERGYHYAVCQKSLGGRLERAN